jgi:hypothetical protein
MSDEKETCDYCNDREAMIRLSPYFKVMDLAGENIIQFPMVYAIVDIGVSESVVCRKCFEDYFHNSKCVAEISKFMKLKAFG